MVSLSLSVTFFFSFLPAKERAGHGTFGNIPRATLCVSLFPVDLMYWMNPVPKALGCINVLCDKISRMMKVNEAKQQFFKRGQGMEIIPLTQTAFGSTFCVQANLKCTAQCDCQGDC